MKPLYNNKGCPIPPWDDPRLSSAQQREEWLRGHIRPELLYRELDGVLRARPFASAI